MSRSRSRSLSWSSGQVSDSDDGRFNRSRSQSQSREDEDSRSDSHNDSVEDIDVSNVKLCLTHKAGQMTRSCQSCSAALKMISKNDKLLSKLLAPGEDVGGGEESYNDVAGLLAHYKGRCDDTAVTMYLSSSMINVASQVFSKGTFQNARVWKDLVKDYLMLSKEDHLKLSADIKTEEFINKFRKEKRFKEIFKYHNDVVDALKNLRISQRPVFSAIDGVNSDMNAMRNAAIKAGIEFPAIAPLRAAETVPRQGRTVKDSLKVSSTKNLFPTPDIVGFCEDNGLTGNIALAMFRMVDDYRDQVVGGYMELYEIAANSLNNTDDKMIFYMDLYSHVDGSLRDLIRNKVASLFKGDIKSDLLLHSSSQKISGKPQGLFGGDSKMRAVLNESSKTKTMISKAVYKTRDGGGDEIKCSYRRGSRRSRSRSRSRDRSRSPRRDRYSGSSRGYKSKKSKGSGGGGTDARKKDSKSSKNSREKE